MKESQPSTDTPAVTAANTAQAVLAAFFPPEFKIADIKLHEAKLASFMALEKVASPFADLANTKKAATAEDIARALVILSIPAGTSEGIAQLRSLMADLAAFDTLVWDVASRISVADMVRSADVLKAAIDRALATALPTGKEGERNFPNAAAAASAGDSPSSTLSATSTAGHSTQPSAPTSPSPSHSSPPSASDAVPSSPPPPTTSANS